MQHMIYIEQKNKNSTIETNLLSFSFEKEKIKSIKLNDLWDFKEILCGLDSIVAQPQYFNKDMIQIIQEKNIECLYLEDRLIGGFFEKDLDKYKTLIDLSFLEEILHLKCFKLDAYTSFFSEKPVSKIEDYTPIEKLKKLEYIYISNNGDYPILVDINFKKLKKLKEVNLQYPKKNKTIYQCKNIESINTRYYESKLLLALNWKRLKKFSAYFDKLKNFDGIEKFEYLEEFKGEYTSSLQTLNGLSSKSIKVFYYYTEARKTLMTLQGVSGLKNVEILAFSGLKKLETIADLIQCQNLKELRIENSNIPDDIEKITQIKSLEKLVVDYGQDVAEKYPKIKHLIFHD